MAVGAAKLAVSPTHLREPGHQQAGILPTPVPETPILPYQYARTCKDCFGIHMNTQPFFVFSDGVVRSSRTKLSGYPELTAPKIR